MSQRGRPPKTPQISRDIVEACKESGVVKAAKENMNALDVLVCGQCLQTFHLIHEFHEHKKLATCSKPRLNPVKLNSSAKTWAFMLWKNSSRTKANFPEGCGDNVIMWNHWSELNETHKKMWLAAGTVFWELATVQQSNVDEVPPNKFEAAANGGKPKITAVPLAKLLNDPKLLTGSTVALERVVVPDTDTGKRTLPEESQTKSKRAKVNAPAETTPTTTAEVSEPEAEDSDEDGQEYVVESIVSKRFDAASMAYTYEIKWEGFPSSQNTWEPEANLTHCKAMIAEFELKQRSKDTTGRPTRCSKAKALDKVKSWTGSKDTDAGTSNQADFDPVMDIKIEERDPLDLDYEDEGDHDPGNDMDYEPDSVERSDSPEMEPLPKKTPPKPSPAKQRTQSKKVLPKKTPQSTTPAKKTNATAPNKPAASKIDPKNATLLVANSLGMVRVNAKALPNIKPGIYAVGNNEQLGRIKPLVPKTPSATKSGLVVITSNPSFERPGIRRKPLTPLTANKTPVPLVPKPSNKTPVSKLQISQQKKVVGSTSTPTSVKATTTFTLPPNPGKLPFLVMAPPGSGLGALLIRPTSEDATKDIEKAISESTSAAADKDKEGSSKESEKETSKPQETETNKEGEREIPKGSDDKVIESPEKSSTEAKESPEKKSSPDSGEVGLAMEVSEADAAMEIDKLINEMTGELQSSEGDHIDEITDKVPELKKTSEQNEENKKTSKSSENKEEDEMQVDQDDSSEEIQSDTKMSENDDTEISKDSEQTKNPEIKMEVEASTDKNKESDEESCTEMSVVKEKGAELVMSSSVKKSMAQMKVTSKTKSQKVNKPGDSIVVETSSLMTPQLVTIPEGVDPSSVSLPPNMQLMVAETGEYYLVPQQPEGATVALAQDASGEVKMVAMPGGSQDNGVVVIGPNPGELPGLDLGSTSEDKYFVLMPDGNYMLAN